MATPQDTEGQAGLAKLVLAWLGATLGSLTLNDLVLGATLIYTLTNTYLLVRDRLLRPPAQRPPSPTVHHGPP